MKTVFTIGQFMTDFEITSMDKLKIISPAALDFTKADGMKDFTRSSTFSDSSTVPCNELPHSDAVSREFLLSRH